MIKPEFIRKNYCTVVGCTDPKADGDLLFCHNHRVTWRAFCKLRGVETVDLSQTDRRILLNEFRGL